MLVQARTYVVRAEPTKGELAMTDKRFLSCAETARLVRKALKKAFPDVKFYVQSSTYAGGASISVRWMDGPTIKNVDAVARAYEGKDFDGSIDMGCYYAHWLLPDGSAVVESTPGTEGSMGYISRVEHQEKPHPDAELVHFGADYVSTSRGHSRELLERVTAEVQAETGWDAPEIVDSEFYLNRSKDAPAAYYKRDWTKQIPGTPPNTYDNELSDHYNRALWATGA